MGNTLKNENDWELACKVCCTHYLVEIISFEDLILIRRYCFCGEETLSAESHVFFYMKLKTIYYQFPKFAPYPERNINKYCYTCNEYIKDEQLFNHMHNTIINAADYIYNCKLHKNERLIGFCNSCKQLICEKCINKNLHKNHKIEYTKNLEITEDIMNKYETNLQKAVDEMNNLINLKYNRNDLKLKMINLYEEENNDYRYFDSKDKQIINILKLLKTFIDLYKSHKNNHNIINYQIISNILKHTNFEILRIEDNKRYTNNINIFFKIDLISDKDNSKRFKIIAFKKIMNSIFSVKIIKMKPIENDIYFFALKAGNEYEINIYKNFKESENYIKLDVEVIDFIILENANLVIYSSFELLIYKFSNGNFNFEKKIDLSYNQNNYQVLNHLCKNNFSFLIHDKYTKTITLKYYIYPDDKGTNLLLQKFQTDPINGMAMQANNWIVIGFDFYVNNLYKIYIFDINTKELKSITLEKRQTYYNECIKIFVINFNKVLISFHSYGLIINLKEKQIETKIENGAMECLYQIGDYLLTSSNDYIYQFDIRKGKIYNKIKLFYNSRYGLVKVSSKIFYDFTFIDLIDIGKNYFCGVSKKKIFIYLNINKKI